ncbi:MAG: hypothetical protein Q8M15_10575 [Bacteroidota bacterium]|nr:hypothetical protein [Bacteroidota bacterium]
METNSIINYLKKNAKPFNEITKYSNKPGIYAFFFYGKSFPFTGYKPKIDEIIYIGKTESSQQSRDLNTHFASGKTGSSTVRRSFGALLKDNLNLVPIPRSETDAIKGRLTHYKFDNDSELKLTKWMQTNLGLSFFEYPKSKTEIDELETALIAEIVPVLNIDRKNPNNIYANKIKEFRKMTGQIAYQLTTASIKKPTKENLKISKEQKIMTSNGTLSSSNKYIEIWEKYSFEILNAIKAGQSIQLEIGASLFKKVGNRKSYTFNLEFNNGKVTNNISGSAVARDLAAVLESKSLFKALMQDKWVKLRMDSSFTLHLSLK